MENWINDEINYLQTWSAEKNMHKFTEQQIINFKSFFNRLDLDKDGVLSKSEFKTFLVERGVDTRFLDAIYYIFDKSKPQNESSPKTVKDLTVVKELYETKRNQFQNPNKPEDEKYTTEHSETNSEQNNQSHEKSGNQQKQQTKGKEQNDDNRNEKENTNECNQANITKEFEHKAHPETDKNIHEIFSRPYSPSEYKSYQGALTFDRFLSFIDACMQTDKHPMYFFKLIFDAVDRDENGAIDIQEMKEFTELCGQPLSEEQLANDIANIDLDANGQIDFRELCIALKLSSSKELHP